MYEIGSIVLLDNVIFKTKIEGKEIKKGNRTDHAKKRPAIVIAEDEENTYFLHITSKRFVGNNEDVNQFYVGEKTDFDIGGYIQFTDIHKRDICFREEKAYLENENLKKMLIDFCNYQENIRMDEEYPKIKQIIYNKIYKLDGIKLKSKKYKKVCFFN